MRSVMIADNSKAMVVTKSPRWRFGLVGIYPNAFL